ncbi:MAG: hypothetical protein FD145_1633 [Candidatus Saganbacteria bacterium]|uniref:VCBS repeat-containing protein n=1 Tax=Candidatus Saganbacteria bacterium TaxID=2575572 RepID=A0A833L2I1_UNCSA|nr:MAG: hypothetical protein FD145_1633 [Candidatus Saganbacteria bacterium]
MNIMKILNKYKIALLAIGFLGFYLLFLWNCKALYRIGKIMFYETKQHLYFEKDIDGDGVDEKIIFSIRGFFCRDCWTEGRVEITKNDRKIYQSCNLATWVKAVKIYDINKDGNQEIICKWADGNVFDLDIIGLYKNEYKELLGASGKDVKIFDIDKDGIEEIIEYWRDYDKPFDTYAAVLYRWNGSEYSLWKQGVPVVLDPMKGDRLILGRGKIAVLK